MKISFQPKIIIGSVVGFLGTAIGIIAVFFPSLFNLEQKKIAEYTYTLNTLSDAEKFIDFLKKHQNSIVNLNITYTESERYKDAYDDKGNIILDENADMDGTPKKEKLCNKGLEGTTGYGAIDKDGYIFVKSEFKCLPFLNDFNILRKKGEFGIWIPGKDEGGKDDKNYRIIITEQSKNNSLFKWSIKDRKKNYEEMQLTGIFFVNNFLDTHESDYGADENSEHTIFTMSPQWREKYSGLDQIGIDNVIIVELEPLSQKEIESKNY